MAKKVIEKINEKSDRQIFSILEQGRIEGKTFFQKYFKAMFWTRKIVSGINLKTGSKNICHELRKHSLATAEIIILITKKKKEEKQIKKKDFEADKDKKMKEEKIKSSEDDEDKKLRAKVLQEIEDETCLKTSWCGYHKCEKDDKWNMLMGGNVIYLQKDDYKRDVEKKNIDVKIIHLTVKIWKM